MEGSKRKGTLIIVTLWAIGCTIYLGYSYWNHHEVITEPGVATVSKAPKYKWEQVGSEWYYIRTRDDKKVGGVYQRYSGNWYSYNGMRDFKTFEEAKKYEEYHHE